MTKKEIRNIINKDWAGRREQSKKKSINNSKATKEWKAREKIGQNKIREKHYLQDQLLKASRTSFCVTLSLLVAVTYASDIDPQV